jgi:alpha-1,3-mannosyltransferase
VEILVNVFVIYKVPYTEIDWKELEGVIVNGTMDYSQLKGDNGPLMYPAGFILFFAGLFKLTNAGTNIKLGIIEAKST